MALELKAKENDLRDTDEPIRLLGEQIDCLMREMKSYMDESDG